MGDGARGTSTELTQKNDAPSAQAQTTGEVRANVPASVPMPPVRAGAPFIPATPRPSSHLPAPISAPPPAAPAPVATVAPSWRFVGLAHGSYALFETAAGLVLLDRRAAHERVWFERLQEQFRSGAVPSQRLLLPVPLELDPIAAALLLDRLLFLNAHGFEVAEFGRNFFRIEGVPAWMEPADAEPFLRDLLGRFRDGHWPDADPDLAREELARLAAAKAIRLPSIASDTEVSALVAQLFATRTPLTSPAGRPTYIELNHHELSRRFQK